MTHCNTTTFAFNDLGARSVLARFDGGCVSSDGGALLLGEAERLTGALRQFSACFTDHRDPDAIEHTVLQLLSQRVYGLALGYEDLNDHDTLRLDPLLATLVGKTDPTGQERLRAQDRGKALAGKSTLNRLELTAPNATAASRYQKIVAHPEAIENVFVDLFLQAHATPPAEIVLDFDATDDPLHGHQEGRFFHGYYKEYCYMPLYAFCGEHLLLARLRPADNDACYGTEEVLDWLVPRIRAAWPNVRIILRGDSGFCREGIMARCEMHQIDYVLGLAKNVRLLAEIEDEMMDAHIRHLHSGVAARVFADFSYQTRDSWSRARRVIGKAEYLHKGPNPRFVVTSLAASECDARTLYEVRYCGRGSMENRIKEQQMMLFADRTSTAWLRSNQLRLWFSSLAYTLLHTIRRVGLPQTPQARVQCSSIRLWLLKIGALVRVTVRHVWVALSSASPYQELFTSVYEALRAARPSMPAG